MVDLWLTCNETLCEHTCISFPVLLLFNIQYYIFFSTSCKDVKVQCSSWHSLKLTWCFVSAGWYRGFILKNPNIKVSVFALCLCTCVCRFLIITHLYTVSSLIPASLSHICVSLYYFIECYFNWQTQGCHTERPSGSPLLATTGSLTSWGENCQVTHFISCTFYCYQNVWFCQTPSSGISAHHVGINSCIWSRLPSLPLLNLTQTSTQEFCIILSDKSSFF